VFRHKNETDIIRFSSTPPLRLITIREIPQWFMSAVVSKKFWFWACLQYGLVNLWKLASFKANVLFICGHGVNQRLKHFLTK